MKERARRARGTGSWLRFVGRLLGFWSFFLLVIADYAFQGANREHRTFLAAGDEGDGTQGHLSSPLLHSSAAGIDSPLMIPHAATRRIGRLHTNGRPDRKP